MKLTRLELSGFKSFADSVSLPFDNGVSAIVGPNGCGKSNISDAVRWVLGEQRARLLRSARMDEVIFQGSVKRKPINFVEVSLVFDNSEGQLPVSYREVVVTRRLSRNGQSEYLLNQTPVRLRDVSDLLQGTGLGSDAGVVIEAQMIDRLLSDRAEERRSLFEEAAGIGLYRTRKDATERRLERTSTDLQRLDDIIGEVQTQVRSLARQRGRAERHREYTTQRFAVVMTLARRELAAFEDRHALMHARRMQLRDRLPEARRELAEREKEREARVQARVAAEARRTELERRLGETRLEMERLDGDLKVAQERLHAVQARREKAAEERQHIDARIAQIQREVEAAAAERESARAARVSVQTELDLRTASEEETRGRLNAQRDAVRSLEEALQRQAEGLRTLHGERAAIERESEELRQQSSEIQARVTATARELDAARERVDAARSQLARRESEEREGAAELERVRHQLAAAREHEAVVRIERRELEERLAQATARRDALAALERRREGLTPAVQALLAATDRFEAGTVVGPLSDFVVSSRSDARLAERLLGDWVQAVLVRDERAVQAVRAWHAAEARGPLILLPVTPGPAGSGTAAAARFGLVARAPAEAWVEVLLRGVEPGDEEGDVIRHINGAVVLAGAGPAGLLSRRAELEELQGTIREEGSQLEQLSQAVADAVARHAEAERTLESATERYARLRTGLREAQGAVDDAGRAQLRAERDSTEARQAAARLDQRLAEREQRLQVVVAEIGAGESDRDRIADELALQQATLADLESQQDAARERRVHWQVEEVQVSAREQAAAERQERAERALAEAREAVASLGDELGGIERGSQDLTRQRHEWTERLTERRLAVREMEDAAERAAVALAGTTSAVAAAERVIDAARVEIEQRNEELHRCEIELTEAAGRRQALVERIEGEWHKPIDVLLGEAEEVEGDVDTLRAEAQRLADELERIGPVNLLALEEHAEELKRLDFLTTQRDDLVAARDSLVQALREIEGTAKEMFLTTFNAVREHFQSVFLTLFEGGECDVRLADEHDPLGSDIVIHAAPRGKRTQRIHLLSSGERALVAISLLFAIYLTKPAPFCLLDEVDAPLDDANVMRFVRLLDEFKADTQFIVITHNPRTMQVADSVYGVTMQEPGVSTIVGVRLGEPRPSAA
jgi:chromosome segregation protein